MEEDPRFPPRAKPHPPVQLQPSNLYRGPITILSVLRESPIFSADDVEKLYRGIERNTERPFRFLVLTDSEAEFSEGIEKVPLLHPDWLTKHSKIELFRPDIFAMGERVFYADLDTVICGSLEDVFSYDGDFMMLRDFYASQAHGSGLMAWSRNLGSEIYRDFLDTAEDVRSTMYAIGGGRGDQLFIRHHCNLEPHRFQDYWPKQVCSYKAHCMGQGRPDDVRVLCFHGKPKVGDVRDEWISALWR